MCEEPKNGNSIQFNIPLLNPKEEIDITLSLADVSKSTIPFIKIRCDGATAHKRRDNVLGFENAVQFTSAISVLLVALVVSLSLFSFTEFKATKEDISNLDIKYNVMPNVTDMTKVVRETEKLLAELTKANEVRRQSQKNWEKGKPAREQIIFGILNKSNLSHLVPQIINTGDEIPYWKTGLVVFYHYLMGKGDQENYFSAMKEIVNIVDTVPSTIGFNLYLLGKMEQNRGNSEQAIKYYNQCKEKTPLMYEFLMEQDPAFNVESVKKWLLDNEFK